MVVAGGADRLGSNAVPELQCGTDPAPASTDLVAAEPSRPGNEGGRSHASTERSRSRDQPLRPGWGQQTDGNPRRLPDVTGPQSLGWQPTTVLDGGSRATYPGYGSGGDGSRQ